MPDTDVPILTKMKPLFFGYGDGFALQTHQDEELKLTKHVRIPKKGFNDYGNAEVAWTFNGQQYHTVEAIKTALLADPEARAIIDRRNEEQKGTT